MQIPKIINFFLFGILLSFFLSACDITISKVPVYIPNTKGINANIEIIRFEQDFFALDTSNLEKELASLKAKYPDFTEIFLYGVLRIPNPQQELRIVKGYLGHQPSRHTHDTLSTLTQDLTLIQTQLNELATYFEYYNYDNKKPLTKAFTHLCEYSYDRAIGDGFVPLPLDMTLGKGYPPYVEGQIPMYQQRTLNQEHLVAKAAYALSEEMITREVVMKSNFIIDFMLYEGKKFYVTSIFLPTVADSIKFSFSSHQMDYCRKGELELYKHLTEEEILYSDNMKKYSKFVTPGPFNPQIALPGNSGSWLGYKMILSFAQHQRKILKQTNPKLSDREIDQQVLQVVLKENDPQKFLQLYKPQK